MNKLKNILKDAFKDAPNILIMGETMIIFLLMYLGIVYLMLDGKFSEKASIIGFFITLILSVVTGVILIIFYNK